MDDGRNTTHEAHGPGGEPRASAETKSGTDADTQVVIDAHQHVWDPSRARYDWLGREADELNRAIGFDELRPALRATGVQATVLVQAADNDEDTRLMIDTADRHPEIAAIVAYVPLDRPAEAERRLAELREDPRVVGVRNLIHDIPDPDWLLRPEVDDGLGVLEDAGVAFDLVAVLPRHLEHAETIAARHPRLRMVIDHLAKPPIGLDEREPWWSLIERAAASPQVFAKVSGLYSAAGDPAAWTTDAVRPFLQRAVEVFGADRLMYGGDWPISIPAGGYERVFAGLTELIGELGEAERRAVMGGTARRFYGIDGRMLARAAAASAA